MTHIDIYLIQYWKPGSMPKISGWVQEKMEDIIFGNSEYRLSRSLTG